MSRVSLISTALLLVPLCGCPRAPGDGGKAPAQRGERDLVILDSLEWSGRYLEAGGLKVERRNGALRLAVPDPGKAAAVLAGACAALRRRMAVISANVANAETSRAGSAPAGSPPVPYRRKVLTVTAGGALEVAEDGSGFRKAYHPGHPDADKDGNVLLPNVYVAVELHDWHQSLKEYEVLRLALGALSDRYVAPPAALLREPTPPPAYEPKPAPPPAKATAPGK